MEIKVFQSDKGDCLLVSTRSSGAKKRHILIDGGMAASFREHVAPTLSQLGQAGERLDLVCVSHIDEDHIEGILEMLDQVIDWRVFRFHQASGNAAARAPKFPEPPPVREIWHNAFSEIVAENTGALADTLASFSQVMSGGASLAAQEAADYAASVRQGILLSRKIGAKQLGIPLNPRHGNKLVIAKKNQQPIKIGRLSISLIGPTTEDLEKLREEWNDWLKENQAALATLRKQSKTDEDRLKTDAVGLLIEQAASLGDRLGNRDQVTTPNLASIMFLLEEGNKKALMTGDGHSSDILKGLALNNKLDSNGALHVDVLKVQHHGSEFNLDAEFCRKITADHYIFCGNGAHDNPDLRVLETILNSRLGSPEQRSRNTKAKNPFKFWFNSNSTVTPKKNKPHQQAVEDWVKTAAANSNGKLTFEFITGNTSFLTLTI